MMGWPPEDRDLNALLEKAEAVSDWSISLMHHWPDKDNGVHIVGGVADDGEKHEVVSIDTGLYFQDDAAAKIGAFIAAANPVAVAAIIKELKSARQHIKQLEWVISNVIENELEGHCQYNIGDSVMVRAFDLLDDNEWHVAVVVEFDQYPNVSPYGCKVEGFGDRLFYFDPSEMKPYKQESTTT